MTSNHPMTTPKERMSDERLTDVRAMYGDFHAIEECLAEIDALRAERDEARAELAQAREALEFYAAPESYRRDVDPDSGCLESQPVIADDGDIARRALTPHPGERNTMTIVQLKDLERRLAEAKGPNFDLECLIAKFIEGDFARSIPPNYTASLDAAVALVERVLPDIAWRVTKKLDGGQCYALLQRRDNQFTSGFDIWSESPDCPTPALALCLACVRALIAQGEK